MRWQQTIQSAKDAVLNLTEAWENAVVDPQPATQAQFAQTQADTIRALEFMRYNNRETINGDVYWNEWVRHVSDEETWTVSTPVNPVASPSGSR